MAASGDPYSEDGSYYGMDSYENAAKPGSPFAVDAAPFAFVNDAAEQQRMGQGYPQNGQSWDFNASMLGISRLIDSATRSYAVAKGSMPTTYAGQNGLTFTNGRQTSGVYASGSMLPLLLIGGAVLFMLSK